MKYITVIASDGETERTERQPVVWGHPDNCVLFGNMYTYKGHAIRNAKKRIADGEYACVVKPKNANYYSVRFGNSLSNFLCGLGRKVQGDEE